MNQIVEELAALYAALESPLMQAHHADIAQPWSGLAEITLEVRPNPGLGPVTLEVSVENSGVFLAKEVPDAGISPVRFGVQTDLLPDGPAVLKFSAKQDKFRWVSAMPFKVDNASQVEKPTEAQASRTGGGDVMWRQFGGGAPLENEPRFPAQPFALPIPNSVLRESSSVADIDIFYAIAEAWGHMVMHFLPENPVVLDIGSSCGKLARFLYLNPRLRYVGTDIYLPAIQWCREAFASLAKERFQFDHFDAHSAVYNPQGKIQARDYRFPYADGAFNGVVCASLFTHLLEPDCVHYLEEISRLLSTGGRAIISIHTKPAEGQLYSGDEARIDVDQDYFVELAKQAGLHLFHVVGKVYGQQVLVFEAV
ncbi:MAG TPA: class I SAM-dependent methyltransferase [Bryobacteraceae bacterium]